MSAMGGVAISLMAHECLQLLNPDLIHVFIDLEPMLALDYDTWASASRPGSCYQHLAPLRQHDLGQIVIIFVYCIFYKRQSQHQSFIA